VTVHTDKEEAMEQLQGFIFFLGDLEMFFVGVGVLWFASVYKDKWCAGSPHDLGGLTSSA
jgi:hypothetical protein